MNIIRLFAASLFALTLSLPTHASERKDINPGEANYHRYRFHVITGADAVAVRQHVTVLWDNPGAAMLLGLFDTDDATEPELVALSAGNDRMVSLDLGLLAGTYQLVVGAVTAGTHYHLNVTYGNNELLFAQPNGPLRVQSELFTNRLIAEQMAPHITRLAAAHAR